MTSAISDARPGIEAPRPEMAATPLRYTLCVGALAALVKLAAALPFLTQYGWDRDELYFLQASRHLSLGYVDFPFLTALIGRLTIDLTGPSLVALRLTGVVAGMLTVGLVALCARELGGGIRAQLLAAMALVLTPYGLGIGMIFHPTMFDLLAWVAFGYVALRVLRRPEPRLWPLLGLIAGVGLETKGTVAALLVAFVAGLLLLGPREFVRERQAWIGAAVAVACVLPYFAWELAHGWPSLTFLPTQDAATAASTSRATYVAQQVAFLGGALGLVMLGVIELWRDPRLRALALLAPTTSLMFFVEQGRGYYSLPAIALPLAAGAVAADRWWRRSGQQTAGAVAADARWRRRPGQQTAVGPAGRRRWRRSRRRAAVIAPLLALQLAAVVAAAPLVWPVLPTATMIKLSIWQPSFYKDEIGWPELAAQTARAWRAIPLAQRRDTALLAENYGEAGALALYGPALGLPEPLSGHLSFQYWHPRRMPERYLLTVGFDAGSLTHICGEVRVLARVANDWGIANQEQGQTIAGCKLRQSLGRLWSTRIANDRL